MPIYEYGCIDCGHEWEESRFMSDPDAGPCPQCGSRRTEKQIRSAPGIRPPVDMGWEGENQGKGRWIGGLGKKDDKGAYCRSIAEAEEKAKRKNLAYEKG